MKLLQCLLSIGVISCVMSAAEDCWDSQLSQLNTLTTCLDQVKTEARTITPELVPSSASLRVYMKASTQQPALAGDDVCCRSVRFPATEKIVNPLGEVIYDTYIFRTKPMFDFYTTDESFADEGDSNLYTIGMFDIKPTPPEEPQRATASRPWAHWLQYNVEGLDVSTGDVFQPYFGTVVGTTHVLMVFKQSDRVTIEDGDFNGAINECYPVVKCLFDVNRMVDTLNMELIGVTWIKTTYDNEYYAWNSINMQNRPLSTVCKRFDDVALDASNNPLCDVDPDVCDQENLQNDDDIQTCLNVVKLSANRWSPELVSGASTFETYINITQTQDELILDDVCCRDNITLPEASATVEPLRLEAFPPYVFRSKPIFSFTSKSDGPSVGDNSLYTFMWVDVSVDTSATQMSLPGKPYLHWIRTNVRGLDLSTGTDVQAYTGPVVANKYTILLYRQQAQVTIDPTLYDGAEDVCFDTILCQFDVARMVSEHELSLIGAVWMTPEDSIMYNVYFRLNDMDQSEVEACEQLDDISVEEGDTELDCSSAAVVGGRGYVVTVLGAVHVVALWVMAS